MEKKKKATNKKPIQKKSEDKAKIKRQNEKVQKTQIATEKREGKKHRKISWNNSKQERKLLAIPLLIFIVLIYCVYKVVVLIQNPTDTFTVEQGKIYLEEAATRLYY